MKTSKYWNHAISKKIFYFHQITQKIINYIELFQIKSLAIYLANVDQIETIGIIKWCLDHQVQVFIYNFDQISNEFEFFPITDLNYEVVMVGSYQNVKLQNVDNIKDPVIDLLIVPAYFVDKNNCSCYYPLLNYSKLNRYSYQKIIGIGYQNDLSELKDAKKKKYITKIYKIKCNLVIFANELEGEE